jgi:hypothetical protein
MEMTEENVTNQELSTVMNIEKKEVKISTHCCLSDLSSNTERSDNHIIEVPERKEKICAEVYLKK